MVTRRWTGKGGQPAEPAQVSGRSLEGREPRWQMEMECRSVPGKGKNATWLKGIDQLLMGRMSVTTDTQDGTL